MYVHVYTHAYRHAHTSLCLLAVHLNTYNTTQPANPEPHFPMVTAPLANIFEPIDWHLDSSTSKSKIRADFWS